MTTAILKFVSSDRSANAFCLIAAFGLVFGLQGCGGSDDSNRVDGGANSLNSGPIISSNNQPGPDFVIINETEIIKGVAIGTGEVSSRLTQRLDADPKSDIEGTSVVFPPNSLTISGEIYLEEGKNLVTETLSLELGQADVIFEAAGKAVVVSTSESQDVVEPFTLSIPVADDPSFGLVNEGYENLIVVFKVEKAGLGGVIMMGIIPRSLIVVENNLATIKSNFFGSYQAVFT